MKGEDFAAWLSAIFGPNEGSARRRSRRRRRRARSGLRGRFREEGFGQRSRQKDALSGTTSHERVAAQGCPHCAGRGVVGWGRRLHGLLRFRCKSCGRTFNALTKTPMAHLRKKEKWLDHARAMIEGKSLAKTAQLCGVHPTTAFRLATSASSRAPAVNKPRSLSGIVEADERPSSSNPFKGRWSDLPRPARQRGGKARHPGPYQDNIPVLVARDRKGATFDAVLPQVDGASIGRALAGVVTQDNHLIGRPIAAFARRADPVPRGARARKASPASAPSAHQQRQRLPPPPQTVAQPLQRRRHQELRQTISDGAMLEAWGDKLEPPNWIKGAIGNGPYRTTIRAIIADLRTGAAAPASVGSQALPRF